MTEIANICVIGRLQLPGHKINHDVEWEDRARREGHIGAVRLPRAIFAGPVIHWRGNIVFDDLAFGVVEVDRGVVHANPAIAASVTLGGELA